MSTGSNDFIEASIERVTDPEQRAFLIWAMAALDKFAPEDAQSLVTLLNLTQSKRLVEHAKKNESKRQPS